MVPKGRETKALLVCVRLSQHVEESADASGCVLGESKKEMHYVNLSLSVLLLLFPIFSLSLLVFRESSLLLYSQDGQ